MTCKYQKYQPIKVHMKTQGISCLFHSTDRNRADFLVTRHNRRCSFQIRSISSSEPLIQATNSVAEVNVATLLT